MRLLFIQSEYSLDLALFRVFIHAKVQDIDNIDRQKIICFCSCLNLTLDLERRIVYCSFRIERLPSSLHLYNNSRSVICLAEHIIDRAFQVTLDRMHLLVYKFQIRNLSVRNHLIQKFNHDILRGLSSKDQLEYIIIQQVSKFKIVQHKIKIKC